MKTIKIFVYGSLKKGFWAHHLIESMKVSFLGEVKTSDAYSLYATLGNYPALKVVSGNGGVHGELYEVYELGIPYLDTFECVNAGLYTRSLIELDNGDLVYSYIFQYETLDLIKGGKWC